MWAGYERGHCRSLKTPLYVKDRKAVFQPFPVSLGIALENSEFSTQWLFNSHWLLNKTKRWADQKAYWGWQRPPLIFIFIEAPRKEGLTRVSGAMDGGNMIALDEPNARATETSNSSLVESRMGNNE